MMAHMLIRDADKKDLPVIRALAEKIWPPTYSAILPTGQIDYMLEWMYSPAALIAQMDEHNHHFLILEYDLVPAGFAAYSVDLENKKAKLQKFYLDPALQGKSLGKLLLENVSTRIRDSGCSILQLDVNRKNKATAFYKSQGFSIVGEKDADIGNGFFMRDYVMEKRVDG